MIGLLPDKTADTYGRFFAMVWSYLDQNGLPNDFTGHFFMTDFERNIRDHFMMFWPNARLLGCYFHFSQVNINRKQRHSTMNIGNNLATSHNTISYKETRNLMIVGLSEVCALRFLYIEPISFIFSQYYVFLQLIWKRVKKAGLQTKYEQVDKFNSVVRRISALPFTKPSDLDEAFEKFNERAEGLEDEELREFTLGLIDYANTQWRERFCVQDWNLFALNCLLVPSTNNGNEGANGRFLVDFGVHPTFWSFIIDATNELERVETDIPSILYSSLVPPTNALYSSLKEDRERVKANYEAGLIDLDGMMGKMGAISLATGKAKHATDDNEEDPKKSGKKKKAVESDKCQEKERPKKRGRGRPPVNRGKSSGKQNEMIVQPQAIR